MEPEKIEKQLSSKHDDCDWLLQDLVEWANTGVSTAVTLTTGAGLVTGVVIGGEEFLDLYKELYAGRWPEPHKASYFESIEKIKFRYKRDDEVNDFDPPIYIHMKDVKIFNAGVFVPSGDGLLWRGKLDSIIGFSIGVIASDED